MSDSVKTPSETPNQPAVETPAAVATPVAAATVDPTPSSTPNVETPAAPAATTEPKAEAPAPTAEQTKALADAAAAKTAADAAAAKTAADAAAAETALKAIPETYEIKAPDGVEIDKGFVTALTPALKKAGLTQAQLQTVAESFIEFQMKVPGQMLERDLEVTMKDPEIGGMNYGRTQAQVNAALAAFTDTEFRQFVAKAGIANRLEFVRVFARIGKAMQGDTPARGGPDGMPATSRAERMYGKTTTNT